MSRDSFDPSDLSSLYDPPRAGPAVASPEDGRILAGWERLRIAYNLALAVEVVFLIAVFRPARFLVVDGAFELGLACFGANVCFSVGPIAEFYLSRLGLPSRVVRAVLFALGMALSMLLAGLVIRFPGFPAGFLD